jgi:hypothetical protein
MDAYVARVPSLTEALGQATIADDQGGEKGELSMTSACSSRPWSPRRTRSSPTADQLRVAYANNKSGEVQPASTARCRPRRAK